MVRGADPTLDTLLALDGQVFFVDDKARFWVKFEVKRVEPSEERPHGLRYSLTCMGPGANGSWGSTTPTLLGAAGRRRATIGIGFAPSGPTIMSMPPN
jgi:hypothetical protein